MKKRHYKLIIACLAVFLLMGATGIYALTRVSIDAFKETVSEDSNTSLRTAPILVDDDGLTHRMIGDNFFQGVPIAINVEHHEMHEGDHYFFKTFIVDTGGDGSTSTFSFTTPNTTTRVHARARLTPDADYTVTIYEGATVTGGTPLNGFNNQRDSANVAELSALSEPTVSVAGTPIWTARNGGGKDAVGVSPGFSYEIIAKTDTTYVFTVVKNVANQPQIVDVDFWWYEHVSGE